MICLIWGQSDLLWAPCGDVTGDVLSSQGTTMTSFYTLYSEWCVYITLRYRLSSVMESYTCCCNVATVADIERYIHTNVKLETKEKCGRRVEGI